MLFFDQDNTLLEKSSIIWNKVTADIKKIDSKPFYNKEVLKTKIKSHSDEVTDFYFKKTF